MAKNALRVSALLAEARAWRDVAAEVASKAEMGWAEWMCLCWWLDGHSVRWPFDGASSDMRSRMWARMARYFEYLGTTIYVGLDAGGADRLDGEHHAGPRVLFCLLMELECEDEARALRGAP